jgi:hypothetical protein
MFSGDMGRHPRRNRSAAAPPRTQGHVAGQSIHGRHGPTTAPIATGHAHAHLIRHRACEQTCPAPTARPATPGRGCHRPPRPTFAVTVQEHLNSTQDHQKVLGHCFSRFDLPLQLLRTGANQSPKEARATDWPTIRSTTLLTADPKSVAQKSAFSRPAHFDKTNSFLLGRPRKEGASARTY